MSQEEAEDLIFGATRHDGFWAYLSEALMLVPASRFIDIIPQRVPFRIGVSGRYMTMCSAPIILVGTAGGGRRSTIQD